MMSQSQVITYVPEQSLHPRRLGKKYLFIDALSVVGLCLYLFFTGQFPVFYPEQSVQEPAASAPVEHEPEPEATPAVANDEHRRQLRRGFRIGQAVARLEKALEAKPSR
ncbi:MAG: hypothetical protein A2951_02545 [Candidatus Buchananbacteria bacterium RIFCSPLOWO2_01_FULL_56_15]|uniref:Uncharacterized protein n=1 Tax=Candidatus Buchananbacteria bacterium RIFCSPLOWO2_01_FULL_56_15 TaxID=1797547 RepID=A0A1G1YS29_9BACT|nr:MAG: hypothetical protein A2951_02545 [Candidatus Buchananbacteria bacterium RIFCSPLOWO2_01_FULL_56_15]